jgi:hypothetical protein
MQVCQRVADIDARQGRIIQTAFPPELAGTRR